MASEIKEIRLSYDNGTLRDGFVIIIETEKGLVEHMVSWTEWSSRYANQSFDILDTKLTTKQINEIIQLSKRTLK